VINGLDGFATPLGIVPLGTANDFARQAGIPLDPLHAMDVILGRKPALVDTAELNGRRFLNVSTGGFGAEATAEIGPEAKESLGPLAYAIAGVRKLVDLQPRRATFQGPGFSLACDFVVFAVGNGRMTGGGAYLTPAARLTDGLLDLCVIEAMPRSELARLALRVRRGEHVGTPGVHYAQLPALTVWSPHEISVNVDGEPTGGGRLSYRVRRSDLLVHVVHLPGDAAEPLG
jgi:YegS/Rv2252/BmrU family lipid kinase